MWLNPQFPADLVTLLKKSLIENFIFCAMNGLHLNKHCTGDPALNFVKIIRSILDSGSAKQKPKEAHSKISSFWSSGNIPRSDKSEAIYALSHNLNKETMKLWNGKKILSFPPLRI